MDWPIIVLGMLLGLILAAKEMASHEEVKAAHRSPPRLNSNQLPTPPLLPTAPRYQPPPPYTFQRLQDSVEDILRSAAREADLRRGIVTPPSYRQARNEAVSGKNFVEGWRKSVSGLIRLAEGNMQFAKSQMAVMNYRGAAEASATCVENVSRALLHCYGEKPDLNSGQEEPLRLLARRFQGEEKAKFEKTIDEAVQLRRNEIVGAYHSEKNIQAPLLTGERTKRMLETANKIFVRFRLIIEENFGTEIAELQEKCPRCGALSIGVWAFGQHGAIYQCNMCGYKWVQPTQQTGALKEGGTSRGESSEQD